MKFSFFAVAYFVAVSSELNAGDFRVPPLVEPGQGACISAGLIYSVDDRPTPQCHASTIVETPAGLVAAWFAGTRERHPDVGIRVARHDGSKWGKSVEVANGIESAAKRFPTWNPVLFQPQDGPLMLFFKKGPNPRQWWGMLTTSEDNGDTWSELRRLGTDEALGEGNPNLIGPVKNKPIQLANGSILCPSSTEHKGWRVHFELTRDFGRTWEVIGPINDASQFDAIQPSILRYGEGRMQVLCRSRQNVIAQSWSEDGGKSWSAVTATDLPNPNAGTDAVTLSDGRQLLVYNHTVRQTALNGREMLNVALSRDGETWQPTLTLERETTRAEFSYPAVIQTSDGKVHITYTWRRVSVKYVVLDPARL